MSTVPYKSTVFFPRSFQPLLNGTHPAPHIQHPLTAYLVPAAAATARVCGRNGLPTPSSVLVFTTGVPIPRLLHPRCCQPQRLRPRPRSARGLAGAADGASPLRPAATGCWAPGPDSPPPLPPLSRARRSVRAAHRALMDARFDLRCGSPGAPGVAVHHLPGS